jgi:hypothetical protein
MRGRLRRKEPAFGDQEVLMKGAEKPKKPQKKKAQKTLKERRSEKRAGKKSGSSIQSASAGPP